MRRLEIILIPTTGVMILLISLIIIYSSCQEQYSRLNELWKSNVTDLFDKEIDRYNVECAIANGWFS